MQSTSSSVELHARNDDECSLGFDERRLSSPIHLFDNVPVHNITVFINLTSTVMLSSDIHMFLY